MLMANLDAIDRAVERLARITDSIYMGLRFCNCPIKTVKPGKPLRLLFPTSNYAFGSWQPDEDIHLVCMSDDRPETFWDIVGETVLEQETKLAIPKNGQLDLTDALRLTTFSGDGQLILHHCRMPETFDLQLMGEYGVPLYTDSLPRAVRLSLEQHHSGPALDDALHKASEKLQHSSAEGDALGMVHDITQLLGRFGREDLQAWEPHHITFCNALLCLRRWADKSGIFSASLGFLDPDTLLWLVYNDHSQYHTPDLDLDSAPSEDRTRQYLYDFFSRCCRFAFEIEGESIRFKLKTPSGRSPAAKMSRDGVWAVWGAFRRVDDAISGTNALDVGDVLNADGLELFLADGDVFIKVYAEYFSPLGRDRFRNEALPAMLQQVTAKIGESIGTRVWPRPIMQDMSSGSWTYVIGLKELPGSAITSDQLREQVKDWASEASYDRARVYVETTLVTAEEITKVIVSRKRETTPSDDKPTISRSSRTNTTEQQVLRTDSPLSPPDTHRTRFHPAGEALSRLRWDPAHTSTAYEVGYEDRFEGLKWMALEQWGCKATEEEDFVPEHRIRQFRRKADGEVVWSREGRLDLS